MCRALLEGGRRCPACSRGPVRNARQAAYRATKRAEKLSAEKAGLVVDEDYTPSTFSPGSLAFHLGYQVSEPEPTPELRKWAATQVDMVRAEIKAQGAELALMFEAPLEANGADWGVLNRPEHKVRDRFYIEPWRNSNKQNFDWYFEEITEEEKSRLRRRWFAQAGDKNAIGVDEIEDHMPIEEWLDLTRLDDLATAISHGRVPHADAYGGKDVTGMIDSPYDIREIFGSRKEAIEEIAQVESKAVQKDEIMRCLPECTHGPAPWELTEAQYADECRELRNAAAWMDPVLYIRDYETDDEVIEFSPEDQERLDRYAELVPKRFDVRVAGGVNPDVLRYRAMLKLAQKGGLI